MGSISIKRFNTDNEMISSCRFITQEGRRLELTPHVPAAITNAVSWRKEGLRYRKNEVFLDVIESVNLLVCSFLLDIWM